jgi:hypothetical protein
MNLFLAGKSDEGAALRNLDGLATGDGDLALGVLDVAEEDVNVVIFLGTEAQCSDRGSCSWCHW